MSQTLGGDTPVAEPSTPAGPPTPAGHIPTLMDKHAAAVSQFESTSKAMGIFAKMSAGLAALSAKGDTVSPEDVIGEAGKLVGAGLDPTALAGLLADMPQGSQAIQAWLQQHALTMQQNLAQVSQAHKLAQHQMGVTAIHLLAGHSLSPSGNGQTPTPSVAGINPLTNSGVN